MSWAEVKKINSDLSTPLNELPRGIFVNPMGSEDYGSHYKNAEYLQHCKSTKTISSSYVESSNRSIQRYNELWSFADSTNILRKVDLLTGTGTNVLTTNNNITGLILVTKTYVYFWEENYISRYNKDTGEYKTSTNTLMVTLDRIGYICYENDIYAYCLNDDTLDGKGYYKVTDNVDNGGVFTFTKVSTNLPISNEKEAVRFNGCVKSIIELPDNQILIGWNMSHNNYVYLLKIDVTNGSRTVVEYFNAGDIYNSMYKFTLCPIKDDEGKIVGVIFGLNRNKLYLYRVDGTSTSELSSNLYTYNSTGSVTTEYDVGYYDNGIFYTLDTRTGEYRVDSSLAEKHSNTAVFLPKGIKFSQYGTEKRMISLKIRDCLTIENGNLIYNSHILKSDENGVFICDKSGIYDLETCYDSAALMYVNGTFF